MADSTTALSSGGDIVEIPSVVVTTGPDGTKVIQGRASGGYASSGEGVEDITFPPPVILF